MRYIFNTKHQEVYTNERRRLPYLIVFIITLIFLFLPYSCGKNETITEEIAETSFVTKKDSYLYGDIIEKTIIDEIPAFIKIKTVEKTILIFDGDKNKTYYKTNFNNNSGWVESIYLANINHDKEGIKEPSPYPTQSLEKKPDIAIESNLEKKLANKKPPKNTNPLNYFIQVASFRNHTNAKKLLKKIQTTEIPLRIEKTC